MKKKGRLLEGKVAIVTGGKSGMGEAIALAFAEAGADVAICGRVVEDGKLQGVADRILKLGQRSLAIKADISKSGDVDNLVNQVMDEFGVVDLLVNNASIHPDEVPMLDSSEDTWDNVMDIVLKGGYLCSKAVCKCMVNQKMGNIINIASNTSGRPMVNGGPYNVAKAGVAMLNRILALELAKYNIRVNAIAPGWIKTPMSEFAWGDPEELKRVEATIPLGRIGMPSEIANVALFLASDASSFITGQIIYVNGGSFTY